MYIAMIFLALLLSGFLNGSLRIIEGEVIEQPDVTQNLAFGNRGKWTPETEMKITPGTIEMKAEVEGTGKQELKTGINGIEDDEVRLKSNPDRQEDVAEKTATQSEVNVKGEKETTVEDMGKGKKMGRKSKLQSEPEMEIEVAGNRGKAKTMRDTEKKVKVGGRSALRVSMKRKVQSDKEGEERLRLQPEKDVDVKTEKTKTEDETAKAKTFTVGMETKKHVNKGGKLEMSFGSQLEKEVDVEPDKGEDKKVGARSELTEEIETKKRVENKGEEEDEQAKVRLELVKETEAGVEVVLGQRNTTLVPRSLKDAREHLEELHVIKSFMDWTKSECTRMPRDRIMALVREIMQHEPEYESDNGAVEGIDYIIRNGEKIYSKESSRSLIPIEDGSSDKDPLLTKWLKEGKTSPIEPKAPWKSQLRLTNFGAEGGGTFITQNDKKLYRIGSLEDPKGSKGRVSDVSRSLRKSLLRLTNYGREGGGTFITLEGQKLYKIASPEDSQAKDRGEYGEGNGKNIYSKESSRSLIPIEDGGSEKDRILTKLLKDKRKGDDWPAPWKSPLRLTNFGGEQGTYITANGKKLYRLGSLEDAQGSKANRGEVSPSKPDHVSRGNSFLGKSKLRLTSYGREGGTFITLEGQKLYPIVTPEDPQRRDVGPDSETGMSELEDDIGDGLQRTPSFITVNGKKQFYDGPPSMNRFKSRGEGTPSPSRPKIPPTTPLKKTKSAYERGDSFIMVDGKKMYEKD